jgi:phage shock protein C
MFCTRCGTQLDDRARFCSQCGTATGFGSQQEPQTVYNRLSRPRQDRKIAGVCAGFARYFGVDVTLVRILTIALAVWPTGVGLVMYIICWIAMPNDQEPLPAPIHPVPTT